MCCKENKCFAAFVLVGIYAPTRILLYIEEYSFGKTTKEGVYAGGDAVTGAATVILAMGAGKAGAKGIDEYIKSKNA